MSLERVIQSLINMGLRRIDAEIYVCLARKGPNKVGKINEILNVSKSKIYCSLKKLQNKGLVTKDGATYSGLAFEEALKQLIKTKKNETKSLQETKEEIYKLFYSN